MFVLECIILGILIGPALFQAIIYLWMYIAFSESLEKFFKKN